MKILDKFVILFVDLCCAMATTLFSFSLVDFSTDLDIQGTFLYRILFYSLFASLISFRFFRTYTRIIRHTTMVDILNLGFASIVKVLIIFVIGVIYVQFFHEWLLRFASFFILSLFIDLILTFTSLVALRVSMITLYNYIISRSNSESGRERVMVYGVGQSAISLIPILSQSSKYILEGFLNFDSRKAARIGDYKVWYFTSITELENIYNKTHCKYVIFPKAKYLQREQERLIPFCKMHGVKMLISPSIDNAVANRESVKLEIREIKIEDLLGREEISIDMKEVEANFKGKRVLVTGAAGSIGSEICRQLTKMEVDTLVLFDSAETPMHEIRLELEELIKKRSLNMNLIPVVGDVRSIQRLEKIFEEYNPQVVFHAAAYKHVPLMEEHPCEAITTNVKGSRNVADCCVKFGVENMIMVSTDKAVNPTNVMGATKRAAEMYVQSLAQQIKSGAIKANTKFTTTRFGNVLGSNGSVIPLFRKQLQKGGPLTVTDERITRFFMSIPEACRLVIEAATMGEGGDIFVFDMGKSVKIIDLARNMIELAGYIPERDIKIAITGLRPGEKLYEEVLSNSENTVETSNKKIRRALVREADYAQVCQMEDEMQQLATSFDIMGSVAKLKELVPEFKSQNSRFEQLDK